MRMSDVLTLFDYNYWATGRILEEAVRLSSEQFRTAPDGHTTSLRDTLAHMLGSERLLRSRWEQGVSSSRLDPEDFPSVEALQTVWAEEQRALSASLDTLDDEALAQPARFERRGVVVSYTLWHLMVQLVNHGTHHRSEAAALLTAYGHSPGDLDFFHFVPPQD